MTNTMSRKLVAPEHLVLSKPTVNVLSTFWSETPMMSSRLMATSLRIMASSEFGDSSGRRMIVENLWQEFFKDPSDWWDNRSNKVSPRCPDFKHKKTHRSLWVEGKFNPPWVEGELASITTGTLEIDTFWWNKRLERYVKTGEYEKALEGFYQMQRNGMDPDKFTFVPVINACSNLRALGEGRKIHILVKQIGCESDVFVGSCLVDMYAKCGSIDDARSVFNNMHTRNVVSWSAMIRGYVKCGEGQKALTLSREMHENGVEPNPVTFVGLLNACASVGELEEGRCIHGQIMQRGWESNLFVASSLVDMYGKCGSPEDAWRIFKQMQTRDVVAWNAMIQCYVKCGQGQKALELFWRMNTDRVEPTHVTFVGVLNACASVGALEEGQQVHIQIIQKGYDSNVFICNSLVDMYAKCGSIEDAWFVLEKMPRCDVVAWTAMIVGCVKCGQAQRALHLFQQMQWYGVEPNLVTFSGVLNACASITALKEGKYVHEQIVHRGLEADIQVSCCLIDMYNKCGSVQDAWRVFNEMPTKDVVAWNSMILGCVKCGQELKALELYRQLKREGVDPSTVTFVSVLNACAGAVALEEGKCIHQQIIQGSYESDVSVGNSLVDMYAKCGSIEDAWKVFSKMHTRDMVSWNTMLGGYALHGYAKEAVGHFVWMCQEGVKLNDITFVSLLSACSHGGLVDEGLHYFESMYAVYNVSATAEHYACLVDLLGRAGRLQEAEEFIKTMCCTTDADVWMGLLSACRVHNNMEHGERIAKQVVELNPKAMCCS